MTRHFAAVGLVAGQVSACTQPQTLFDGEVVTDCAGHDNAGDAYVLHVKDAPLQAFAMWYRSECRTGAISTLFHGDPNYQNRGNHYDDTSWGFTLATDDVLVGTVYLYTCNLGEPTHEFCGMKGNIHRGSKGQTEAFEVGDHDCINKHGPQETQVNADGMQLMGFYGLSGDRVDQVGLLLRHVPCSVNSAYGDWEQVVMIGAATSKTWHWGSRKTHEESKSSGWSDSLSATVKRNWNFGKKGGAGVSISNQMAWQTSSMFTDTLEEDVDVTETFTWKDSDIGKTLWQFNLDVFDDCQHEELGKSRQFLTTVEGLANPPCCLPSYFHGSPDDRICSNLDGMRSGGYQSGCKVQSPANVHCGTVPEGLCMTGCDPSMFQPHDGVHSRNKCPCNYDGTECKDSNWSFPQDNSCHCGLVPLGKCMTGCNPNHFQPGDGKSSRNKCPCNYDGTLCEGENNYECPVVQTNSNASIVV